MKKEIKCFLACILLLVSCLLNAQETKKTKNERAIDSLLNVLKILSSFQEVKFVDGTDTIEVNSLNELSRQYKNIANYDKALLYAQQGLKQSEKLHFKRGLSSSYKNIGVVYYFQSNYEKALENYLKSLQILEEIGDKKGVANNHNDIGNVHNKRGDFEKALKEYFEALKIREDIEDQKGIAESYSNIGNIYEYQGKYEKSSENHFKSLKIKEEIGDSLGIAISYLHIGNTYWFQNNYQMALKNYLKCSEISESISEKRLMAAIYGNIGIAYLEQIDYKNALEYNLKSLKINEEIGDKPGITASYINIGNTYENLGNYQKALNNYLNASKISVEIGNKNGIANSYIQIGNIYKIEGKFEESYYYLNQSLILAKEIGLKDLLKENYSSLFELFEKKGDYKQAYNYHKLYSDIKDTLLNEASSKQITEMNVKYESEKKEKDIQLLTKDKDLQHAEIKRQKLIRNGFIVGLAITLLLAFVIYNRFQVTRKQKKIIEYQNSQIVESINYSKKIQDSLLPSIESMQQVLPELFVFYEPKQIVSGDFYFFKEFENYVLLACVDCTGHGVPGGFMSTLGSLLLDKIANDESLKPSEILAKLNDEIIRILHQQSSGELQDGMDLSVCLIDRHNRNLEFSGARNGIIVVTNNEAKRYKASPLPVGGNYMKKGIPIERNFQTQSILLNSTDWVYMYTDGFIEQVGGEADIPMNYEQFEKQLMELSKQKTPADKMQKLQSELDNWRGGNERTDDVLVVGFKCGW